MGDGREAGRHRRGRRPECARGRARSLCLNAGWAGGSKLKSGARFAQGMPEPIVAAARNCFLSWRAASFATMRRSKGGTARSNNSPQECPSPLWELLVGGDAGDGGIPKGGRDGGGCWHTLCCAPYCCSFRFSIIITDRGDCALLGAHNCLASVSNTGPFPFCEAPFRLEGGIRCLQGA